MNEPRSAALHRSLSKNYPVIERGEGAWLIDTAGKRYLDFASSAIVNFIGHSDPDVARAIAEQAARLEFVHSGSFTTAAAELFARDLLDFAGTAYADGAVFFTSGGSESVETALKLARQYNIERGQPQRYQVVSRRNSYHGATFGAMAVSGNQSRRGIYLSMLREFPKASTPNCYRCQYDCSNSCFECGQKYAAEVEEAIRATESSAAAFILEPISGATLGAAAPPAGYMQRVAEICRQHNILLIADEVMTGFGRTGRNFAMQHWRVAPDILATGKGISSGYVPLGAVIVKPHVVDAIRRGSGTLLHGFTYNAHPVSVAAGRAVLKKITGKHLVEDADNCVPGSAAALLQNELQTLWSLPSVGDVRGIGLLWAVEFVADRGTKQPFSPSAKFATKVSEAAMQRGVVLYPMQGCADGRAGDHVMIAPPAITSKADIAWAVAQVRDAIAEAEASR